MSDIVERALELFGAPIYVKHEVVHNRYVVENLRNKGAVFIEELSEVPDDSTLIFSAHGVSQAVREEAKDRKLKVFDATCPLVTKVHMEVVRIARKNQECILIGHHGHPEVEGTMGQYDNATAGIYLVETIEDVLKLKVKNSEKLNYVTQTTLSMDDASAVIKSLGEKFPGIQGPKKDDICYATQNRQDAVRELADSCELVLVVGSPSSSNSNRLNELAIKTGANSYLIDSADEIRKDWLIGVDNVGVTAGASAPEILVKQVIDNLIACGGDLQAENEGVQENIVFALPIELR